MLIDSFMDSTIEKRFWKKVRKTRGCWHWIASKDSCGYGNILYAGKIRKATRVLWAMQNGELPPPDKVVMHSCDNPSCVKPAHLRLGTIKENVQDCERKGRGNHPRAEKCGKSKLTWKEVKLIRKMYANGFSGYRISKLLKMNKANVYYIIAGTTWNVGPD